MLDECRHLRRDVIGGTSGILQLLAKIDPLLDQCDLLNRSRGFETRPDVRQMRFDPLDGTRRTGPFTVFDCLQVRLDRPCRDPAALLRSLDAVPLYSARNGFSVDAWVGFGVSEDLLATIGFG